MKKQMGIAGIELDELEPVRLLVSLLRHPDPAVGVFAKQALCYVRDISGERVLAANSETGMLADEKKISTG